MRLRDHNFIKMDSFEEPSNFSDDEEAVSSFHEDELSQLLDRSQNRSLLEESTNRPKKKVREKIQDLSLVHVNTQTLTDIKLNEINNETIGDHLHFFTELNIRDDEHLNVVTNDDFWEWVIIKKHENDCVKRRIGMRYSRGLKDELEVVTLAQGYLLQEHRPSNQTDLSIVQYLVLKVQIYHLTFKFMLVYRLDDADAENTEFIFREAEKHKVHYILGDLNIDYSKKSCRDYLKTMTKMTQIVKQTTRFGFGRGGQETRTIIDHVWCRPDLASKTAYDVVPVTFSDHELVRVSIDATIPRPRIRIPIPINKFRRYFPKQGVKWADFPLPDWNFLNHEFSDIESFYAQLQGYVKSGCEKMGITFREKPFFKSVFKFEFQPDTRQAKRIALTLRGQYLDVKKALKLMEDAKPAHEPDTPEIVQQRALKERLFEAFKKARNRYNLKVRRDRCNSTNEKMVDKATSVKECWMLVNRSKGVVKQQVDDLKEDEYQPEPMAKFFKDRSLIGATEESDLSVDMDFPYLGDEELREIDIVINDELIDEAMNYKPSAVPDPDTLSMLIWNKLYFGNKVYNSLIKKLFYLVFEKFHKIPGLQLHDVQLFLKKDIPTCQKDLRPVASLPSLGKRMLRIVYKQLKR